MKKPKFSSPYYSGMKAAQNPKVSRMSNPFSHASKDYWEWEDGYLDEKNNQRAEQINKENKKEIGEI